MKEFKLDRYKYNTKSTKRLVVDATKWHSKIKLQDIHFVDSPQNRWKPQEVIKIANYLISSWKNGLKRRSKNLYALKLLCFTQSFHSLCFYEKKNISQVRIEQKRKIVFLCSSLDENLRFNF